MNWSPVAAAVSVPHILRKLAIKFPFVEKPDEFPSFDILKERYNKWHLFLSFLVFPIAIGTCYSITITLKEIAQWLLPEFNKALFILEPETLSFLLPSIFLGLIAAMAVMFLITWLFLGKRYKEYFYYSSWRSKSDGIKIMKLMAIVITPPALFLAFLMVDYYAAIYQDKITINDFTSFLSEKEYAYNELSKIEHSTWTDDNNNLNHQYSIIFKDNYEWNFAAGFFSIPDEKRDAILNHLIDKTGVKIIDEAD